MVETSNLRGAEKLLRRIWAACERMQPPDDVMRARVLHDFAAVLCSLQRGYEAEQLCRAALLDFEASDTPARSVAAAIYKQILAEAILAPRFRQMRPQDAAEAEQLLREALAESQQEPTLEPSTVAEIHAGLSRSLGKQDKTSEALQGRKEEVIATELVRDLRDGIVAGCSSYNAEKVRMLVIECFQDLRIAQEAVEMCQLAAQQLLDALATDELAA
ncbi:hypothetical protein COCSUDRAFT_58240 [Coccomyxa subellipsoidea C-169]|uniref:Uncharacterized protein n=1 Tax=Coccomyxa subellipsoidea (strain C-169) TaxID=574566 RepID=I0YNN8_COCSC|nr:hypothetical protein COCSUDRAFT_58240 [Coccomyxa subellipsoidea C-169]EIE20007.1 hypothetical protein COCSUDRAFT_58240 [Coccomyxa subellipsoidea C-169]|eukprot:XP_005644551.1 hypothetical protein COCSUDRAFT_58240 [Coccomyxa subellipsoidea C-169]